jgi:hypothetical protein
MLPADVIKSSLKHGNLGYYLNIARAQWKFWARPLMFYTFRSIIKSNVDMKTMNDLWRYIIKYESSCPFNIIIDIKIGNMTILYGL